ncbi:MAG: DUF5652 family protein [Candidatus Pacearchaeota archaeon]|nr:DUF5652 family protein [Candidatus Pacearchaeota archaeon]
MNELLKSMAQELGVSLILLAVLFIWSVTWKLLGLWRAARNKSVPWFIVLALFNTIGILEILYIFIFSEMKPKKSREPIKKPIKRKKRR